MLSPRKGSNLDKCYHGTESEYNWAVFTVEGGKEWATTGLGYRSSAFYLFVNDLGISSETVKFVDDTNLFRAMRATEN